MNLVVQCTCNVHVHTKKECQGRLLKLETFIKLVIFCKLPRISFANIYELSKIHEDD